MKAEIISIGTELLLGEITDTNAPFLAGELPELGIDLFWISQVGDNRARLLKMLKRAWQRSDLILATGGLGPTDDDITREAVAELVGEKMVTNPVLERELREFFRSFGREMSPSNLKQALVIPSSEVIPNPNGTAPGWWVEKDGHILVVMPGPPREMQPMWRDEILPRLRRIIGGGIIFSRTLKLFGIPESTVSDMISPLLAASNPTLGIYAKTDGIHLRLAAKTDDRAAAEQLMAAGEAEIRSRFADHIWGCDDETMQAVAGRGLRERKLSLAVMEDYSGGRLIAAITAAPEIAAHLKGGLVVTSEESLVAGGVAYDTIAREGRGSSGIARAMAEAALSRLGTDIGLGISGLDEGGGGGCQAVRNLPYRPRRW